MWDDLVDHKNEGWFSLVVGWWLISLLHPFKLVTLASRKVGEKRAAGVLEYQRQEVAATGWSEQGGS